MSPDKPTAILKAFGTKEVTPGIDIVEEESDIKALEKARSKRIRFKFEMVGIPIGAILHSVFDNDEFCTVTDHEKVIFRGEEHSLTSFALVIAGETGKNWKQIQGPRYWKYDDETLTNLRDELDET